MMEEKLLRIQNLYNQYKANEEILLSTTGIKSSIRRQQVFLKEKILSSFKDIQREMQPKLFVVSLATPEGNNKTIIMRAESYKDIKTYVKMVQLIHKVDYTIIRIEELPTIFEGLINITTHTKK